MNATAQDEPFLLSLVWNHPPKLGEVLDTSSGHYKVMAVTQDQDRPLDPGDGFSGPAVQRIRISGSHRVRTHTRYAVYGVRTKEQATS